MLLLQTFQVNLVTVDVFIPVMEKVISGDLSAEDALHVLTTGFMNINQESEQRNPHPNGLQILSGLN